MSAVRPSQGTEVSGRADSHPAVPAPNQVLFVIPRERGDGFQASIRGHMLDLADPTSGHALAPTPNDLFVVAHASELAWCARRLLDAHGLSDGASVSATWRTDGDLSAVAQFDLTVTLPPGAQAVAAGLDVALDETLAAGSVARPTVHIIEHARGRET
jgi:hypothetical protein